MELTEVHLPPFYNVMFEIRYTMQHREDAAGLISSRCNQDYNLIIPASMVRVEPGGGGVVSRRTSYTPHKYTNPPFSNAMH